MRHGKGGESAMNKIASTLISLVFVLGVASFSFAANEVQLKGVITKISGNKIIIKDDVGRETVVEGSLKGIKVGDSVLIKGEAFKVESLRAELRAQDIDFLTKQCSIDRSDVNVIPHLEEKTRMKLMSRIDRRDCKLMAPYKASREYFKSLKPKSKLPLPPAGWDTHYLTDKEFEQYTNLIANAPW